MGNMSSLLFPNMPVEKWLIPICRGIWNHAENKPAGSAQVRRWIAAGAIHINNEPATPKEIIDFPVFSLVVFPKSKKKITLW